jgi:hypothetical protein
MTLILSWLFSPLGRAAGIAVLVLTLLGGVYTTGYVKGHHNDHVTMTAKIKKEHADAVAKADAARAAAQKSFDAGKDTEKHYSPHNPLKLLPRRLRHGSDGFARD